LKAPLGEQPPPLSSPAIREAVHSEAGSGQDLGGEGWGNQGSQRREEKSQKMPKRMPKNVQICPEGFPKGSKIEEKWRQSGVEIVKNRCLGPDGSRNALGEPKSLSL
jgi:hypothetical protein